MRMMRGVMTQQRVSWVMSVNGDLRVQEVIHLRGNARLQLLHRKGLSPECRRT